MLSAGVALGDWVAGIVGHRRTPRSRGVVLYYHAVPARHRRAFADQMDVLSLHVQPWALDAPAPAAPSWAGISFDDAYVSVLENAVPELVARRLPFTVFVPTGSLGQRPAWVRSPGHPLWSEEVMSAKQLAALARLPGAILGSHTVNHPRLTGLTHAALERELRDSKHALEDIVGRPVTLLSFPRVRRNSAGARCCPGEGHPGGLGLEPVGLKGRYQPEVGDSVAVEPNDLGLGCVLKLRGCYRWAAARVLGSGTISGTRH